MTRKRNANVRHYALTQMLFFFWQKGEIYLDWQDLELLKHLFTTGLFLYHPKTEKPSFSDVLERGQ